jgi:hypothetical protein
MTWLLPAFAVAVFASVRASSYFLARGRKRLAAALLVWPFIGAAGIVIWWLSGRMKF